MIDVQDGKLDLQLARKSVKYMDQDDRIGSARNRYSHPAARGRHVITRDDFRNPFEQAVRQYRHSKGFLDLLFDRCA